MTIEEIRERRNTLETQLASLPRSADARAQELRDQIYELRKTCTHPNGMVRRKSELDFLKCPDCGHFRNVQDF